MNARPTVAVPSQPATGSPMRLPRSSRTTKPARGRAGISQTSSTMVRLTPQQPEVVGVGVGPTASHGHHETEADDDLGGGHHENEEHDHLSGDVVEHLAEGD